MDLETARASTGKWVTYDDGHGTAEDGVVSSVTDRVAYVRFRSGVEACSFASLTLLAGEADDKPAGWEPRFAAHAAGASPFKFARPEDGAALIAAERLRQVTGEGWTAGHDQHHDSGELARAGACYALHAAGLRSLDGQPIGTAWPWPSWEFEPSGDRLRTLVKAGSLIAAEIDRLLALAGENGTDGQRIRSDREGP